MDPKGVTESVMAGSSKRECVGKRKGKTRGERGERNYRLTTIPARVGREDEDVGMVRKGKGGGEKGID